MKLKRIDLAAAVAALPRVDVADWTFRELVEAYTARHAARGDDMRLRKWVALLGDLPAWQVPTEQIVAGRDAMVAQGYSTAAADRDLSTIGSVYIFAMDKKMTPRGFVSPTRAIRRGSQPIRRVMLTDEERAAVMAGARAHRDRRFALLIALLADTGARRGEILERRWSEFDIERGQVVVLKTKTGRPRTLFYSAETAALLERLRPSDAGDQLVFVGRRGQPINFRKAWLTLAIDIGRPDLRMHDLRHAAAARLLRAGVTTGVAAQVLGHGVEVLTRRYGHLEDAALRAAQHTAWGRQ